MLAEAWRTQSPVGSSAASSLLVPCAPTSKQRPAESVLQHGLTTATTATTIALAHIAACYATRPIVQQLKLPGASYTSVTSILRRPGLNPTLPCGCELLRVHWFLEVMRRPTSCKPPNHCSCRHPTRTDASGPCCFTTVPCAITGPLRLRRLIDAWVSRISSWNPARLPEAFHLMVSRSRVSTSALNITSRCGKSYNKLPCQCYPLCHRPRCYCITHTWSNASCSYTRWRPRKCLHCYNGNSKGSCPP